MASLAELLRELKERSGHSYGVLAKRLHMSTSTLHRYCNGDAVPTEFAPVERFARLCKATPEELVEVHRRWILADADRGRKTEPPTARKAARETGSGAPAEQPSGPEPEPPSDPEPEQPSDPEPEPSGPGDAPGSSRRRRTLVLAAAVAAVVGVGSVALAMNGDEGGGHKRNAGPAASSGPSAASPESPGEVSGKGEAQDKSKGEGEGKGKDGGKEKQGAPSATPSHKGNVAPDSTRGDKGPAAGGAQGDLDVVTTRTKPYAYDEPCGRDFLVNRKPGEVPQPPAAPQDTPSWVGDLGAVASGGQYIEVTVQGLSRETVVLEGMDVRVQSTSAPLTWNNYQMATGCGGDVFTKSFNVDLDDAAPRVTTKRGQRDFPYKVSESDPEVFYINADVASHDVRWYLELRWSSGKRHGVARIDDQGKPFRTSGASGRPTYGWPPGNTKWERQLQDG
ncbi:helix-turn-helix domain-containing protein [Streptomyces sp. NPDC058284]|uniref:helix-turn-helix domain-containing protein n=1 Tax=unclassified Streptomyces TaxID=2593676 RepID=UPI0036489F9D